VRPILADPDRRHRCGAPFGGMRSWDGCSPGAGERCLVGPIALRQPLQLERAADAVALSFLSHRPTLGDASDAVVGQRPARPPRRSAAPTRWWSTPNYGRGGSARAI